MTKYLHLIIASNMIFFGCILNAAPIMPIHSALQKNYFNAYPLIQNNQDISSVTQAALYYLQFRITQNNRLKTHIPLAAIFDIDGTALLNYPNQSCSTASDPAIPYTRTLYIFAKNQGIHVFFISQRPENLRDITEKNLLATGYQGWDGLFLRPLHYPPQSLVPYYIAIRKKIERSGYDIVFNISDQDSHLKGGVADKAFKLP